mgnify:CR=1 FL=1
MINQSKEIKKTGILSDLFAIVWAGFSGWLWYQGQEVAVIIGITWILFMIASRQAKDLEY